jgi:hypothetical protein
MCKNRAAAAARFLLLPAPPASAFPLPSPRQKSLTTTVRYAKIFRLTENLYPFGLQKYPRGRRGSPAKGVGCDEHRESSNLSFCASVVADLLLFATAFFQSKTSSYGEIPKRFKGPVLKTGRWVTPTQGFESLSLRHRRNLEISMISRFLAYQNIVVFP